MLTREWVGVHMLMFVPFIELKILSIKTVSDYMGNCLDKDSGSSVSMFEQTLFCIFPCDKELISTNQLIKPYKNSYTKSKSVSSSFSIQYLSNPASVDFHAEKS